jgi:hypothetical protein
MVQHPSHIGPRLQTGGAADVVNIHQHGAIYTLSCMQDDSKPHSGLIQSTNVHKREVSESRSVDLSG